MRIRRAVAAAAIASPRYRNQFAAGYAVGTIRNRRKAAKLARRLNRVDARRECETAGSR